MVNDILWHLMTCVWILLKAGVVLCYMVRTVVWSSNYNISTAIWDNINPRYRSLAFLFSIHSREQTTHPLTSTGGTLPMTSLWRGHDIGTSQQSLLPLTRLGIPYQPWIFTFQTNNFLPLLQGGGLYNLINLLQFGWWLSLAYLIREFLPSQWSSDHLPPFSLVKYKFL